MAFDRFRAGDVEVDAAAVQVLEIKALNRRGVTLVVIGIRNMPQRPPGDVAMVRKMSREGGDMLQHDGGIPHAAGRKDVRGVRVGALEERGPCCTAIPKDAVDGRRGGYQKVVVVAVVVHADQSVQDGRRAAAGAAA